MTHVIEYHTLDRNADRNQFIADMDEVVQAEDYVTFSPACGGGGFLLKNP